VHQSPCNVQSKDMTRSLNGLLRKQPFCVQIVEDEEVYE
jgi:hypothetical protein